MDDEARRWLERADDRKRLTERQLEVAHLLAAGRTPVEVAAELGVSHHTVRVHVEQIRLRLNRQLRPWKRRGA